jgi:uncharacterized protein (DUF885 family)
MDPTELQTSATEAFATLADEIVDSHFEFAPNMAARQGLHEYDGRVTDFSRDALDRRIREVHEQVRRLGEIDAAALPEDAAHDHALALAGLQAELWRHEDFRGHARNPLSYQMPIDVSTYVKRNYAPLPQRLAALTRHLEAIPGVLAAAQANLDDALPRPPLEMAIRMFGGTAQYLSEQLDGIIQTAAEASGDGDVAGALPSNFAEARSAAVAAVRGYVEFLEGRLPQASEDFAIGAASYAKMLASGEMVDLPVEQVLDVGRRNLAENQEKLKALAEQLTPGQGPAAAMALISAEHPTADSLISDTADMLEKIRGYIIAEDLITVPSEVRCQVAPTPPYMRWGFAFMDSPGAFEEQATEAFYYVTPVEPDWTPEQQEAWLRRFDYYTLQDVSVHEAYPGHYVHFLHRRAVTSRVRKAFGSYAFIEGWAHYCEQMVIEHGYGGEDNLKMRVAQLGEALLRNCRYIVSILMHTQGMSLKEATQFIQDNAYYEELPAHREALRGTFDPGYLNYCLGKLMLLKLRADYTAEQESHSDTFAPRPFHDAVLRYGSPPVPLLRRRLLRNGAAGIL